MDIGVDYDKQLSTNVILLCTYIIVCYVVKNDLLQIMKSRGINDHDLAAVIIHQQKKRKESKNQTKRSFEQSLEKIRKVDN
jgi:hypothetical protein